MVNRMMSFFLFILSLPLLLIILIAVKLTSRGPFIFRQNRLGKNKKAFTLYKIRTMIEGAEKLQSTVHHLNEITGPVFKIHNDPRYTKIGKLLAHTGLDELPQLINIMKGEMAFIGPRPLPVEEALQIPSKYRVRFSVLPGISSPWVISGQHALSFNQWMTLDLQYIKHKSFWYDLQVSVLTILLMIKLLIRVIVLNTR